MVNFEGSGFKDRAEEMFDLVQKDKYEIYISNIVLEEIALNSKKYQEKLNKLIKKFKPIVLFQNRDIEILAHAYTENAFKERKKYDVICDSFHAAIAIAANINYMVSYNYRNLLNITIQEHLKSVNIIAGFTNTTMILPPFMFIPFEDYSGETGSVGKKAWDIKSELGKKLKDLSKVSHTKRRSYHKNFTNKMIKKLKLETINIEQATSTVIL
jgi:predicted nucleic acid-binding protein